MDPRWQQQSSRQLSSTLYVSIPSHFGPRFTSRWTLHRLTLVHLFLLSPAKLKALLTRCPLTALPFRLQYPGLPPLPRQSTRRNITFVTSLRTQYIDLDHTSHRVGLKARRKEFFYTMRFWGSHFEAGEVVEERVYCIMLHRQTGAG
jgi:hypothetical protein